MDKKKIEIVVTIVAVLVFLGLLSSTLSKKKDVPKQKPAATPFSSAVKAQMTREKLQDNLQWGRDPFVTAIYQVKTEVGTGSFMLSAVIWDENKPLAIINGEVVCVGDAVGGCRVIKINKDNAVIEKDGKEETIELYK